MSMSLDGLELLQIIILLFLLVIFVILQVWLRKTDSEESSSRVRYPITQLGLLCVIVIQTFFVFLILTGHWD